jgi:hypothetical protein
VLGVVLEVDQPLCHALLELVNETGMYESPLPCVIRRLVRPIVAGISLFFRQANLKKYWKRCQWAPTPLPSTPRTTPRMQPYAG